MPERWMPVFGYEECYSVSDCGAVVRTASQGKRPKPSWKKLRELILRNGYVRYVLSKDGERQQFLAHRLIWETFNGKIPEGMHINHLNGNKTDNRLSNLAVCTPSENQLHAYRVLGVPPAPNPSNPGSRNGRAKLSESDIPKIVSRYRAGGITQARLAAEFNVSPAMISCIVTGRNWRHV